MDDVLQILVYFHIKENNFNTGTITSLSLSRLSTSSA